MLYLWLQFLQHKTIPCWCSILVSTIGAGPPDPWCQQQPLCIQSIAPQDRSGGGWTQAIERVGNNLQISSGDMWPLNPYKSCAKVGEPKTLSAFMREGSVYEPLAPDCYFDIVIHHNCSTAPPVNFHVPGRATGPSHHQPKAWDVSSWIWCAILHGTCWMKDFNKLCFIVQTTTGSSIR